MNYLLKLFSLLCFLLCTQLPGIAAEKASRDDAVAFVKKGVEYYKKNGKEKALAAFNDPNDEFVKGELYFFVYRANGDGINLAHGQNPKMNGKNLLDMKDVLCSYPLVVLQVMQQLVLNAIQHGFEERISGEIEISASFSQQDECRIVVKDNGVGIAQDCLSKAFDPFYTTKLGLGNSDLGLNLIHNLVSQVLRSKLDLQSRAGWGTVLGFTVHNFKV